MYSEYKEELLSGGELKVTEQGWFIHYYFSGPDLRHNGQFVKVLSGDIDKYIDAYKINFEKYLLLKQTIPQGGEFECKGECNMSIRVGRFFNGVNIAQWFNHISKGCFPISSKTDLEKVVSDYQYCKIRAEEIRSKLYKK